ncbi:MAG: uroporphyrinogen-III synthase, partial [Actinomycetota bacterium]
ALAEAFPMRRPDDRGRVLAPLAELAGSTIADGLGAKGWQVDRVDAYRTTAPDDRAVIPEVDLVAVTFFSPSAVDRWVDRFGVDPPVAVCIGPSTAERATERGFGRVGTADPHTEDGVVALVADLLVDRPLP